MFRKVRIVFVHRVESHQCDACLVGRLFQGFRAMQRFCGFAEIYSGEWAWANFGEPNHLNPQEVSTGSILF